MTQHEHQSVTYISESVDQCVHEFKAV